MGAYRNLQRLIYIYAGGMLQLNHQTDSSDEEIMKLNFRYLVKDFTEEQVMIFNIITKSMLIIIIGTLGNLIAFIEIDITIH